MGVIRTIYPFDIKCAKYQESGAKIYLRPDLARFFEISDQVLISGKSRDVVYMIVSKDGKKDILVLKREGKLTYCDDGILRIK